MGRFSNKYSPWAKREMAYERDTGQAATPAMRVKWMKETPDHERQAWEDKQKRMSAYFAKQRDRTKTAGLRDLIKQAKLPSALRGKKGEKLLRGIVRKQDLQAGPVTDKQIRKVQYVLARQDAAKAGREAARLSGPGKSEKKLSGLAARNVSRRQLKKMAGDMPKFLDQNRPAKVKEIYRALKRDHPDMPAEMKARIAARRGKKNAKSRKSPKDGGPKYKAPIMTKWKEKKSSVKEAFSLARMGVGVLTGGATGALAGLPYGDVAAANRVHNVRRRLLAAERMKQKSTGRYLTQEERDDVARAFYPGYSDPQAKKRALVGALSGAVLGGLGGGAFRGGGGTGGGFAGGLGGTLLGLIPGSKMEKNRSEFPAHLRKPAPAATAAKKEKLSKEASAGLAAMARRRRESARKGSAEMEEKVRETLKKRASDLRNDIVNRALACGEALEKTAAEQYFHDLRKPDQDVEMLGAEFCKLAHGIGRDPWELALEVADNFPSYAVLSKTASDERVRELANFYLDWSDEMEKTALLGKVWHVSKAGLGALKSKAGRLTSSGKMSQAISGQPQHTVRGAMSRAGKQYDATKAMGGGSYSRGQAVRQAEKAERAAKAAKPPAKPTQAPTQAPAQAPTNPPVIQGAPPPAPSAGQGVSNAAKPGINWGHAALGGGALAATGAGGLWAYNKLKGQPQPAGYGY